MAKVNKIYIFLLLFVKNTYCQNSSQEGYLSEVQVVAARNPFKPAAKSEMAPIANAIIITENKAIVSITYNDKNYILEKNEVLGQEYKVEEITMDKVKLINLQSDQNIVLQVRN